MPCRIDHHASGKAKPKPASQSRHSEARQQARIDPVRPHPFDRLAAKQGSPIGERGPVARNCRDHGIVRPMVENRP